MAEGETRRKGLLNAVLFVLTVLSTFFVGLNWALNYVSAESISRAAASGGFGHVAVDFGLKDLLAPPVMALAALYAVVLMAILGGHELGHYLTCRRNGLEATLPYFIPFPSLIGTLGAFIRIKSPVGRKEQFFDIGASGPLTGFLLAVPALVVGVALSKVLPMPQTDGSISLGEPLLLKIAARLLLGPIPAGSDIIIHPIGFAGWVGLLVTALNLIPVGQLDGGHVAYALLGPKSAKLAPLILVILVAMGVFLWAGWLLWAVIVALFMFLPRFRHPRVFDEERTLSRGRVILGFAVLVVFILSFIPDPIKGFDLWGLLKHAGLGVK